MELDTGRLLVRRFSAQDAEGLFALMSDPETCADDGGYPPIQEMDGAFLALVERFSADPDRFAIVVKETGMTAGVVHLMDPETQSDQPTLEIGYAIRKECRRQGYALEALRAVTDDCLARVKAQALCASTYESNSASRKLLEKLGFRQVGNAKKEKNQQACVTAKLIHFIFNKKRDFR
mgnify:FL=1